MSLEHASGATLDDDGRARSRIGGLVLLAIGLAFAWQALNYPIGTLHRTGPGFFPLVIALVVAALGFVLALTPPPMREGLIPFARRPFVFISLGCLAFALLIERAGLIPTSFIAVLLTALSEDRPDPRGTLVLATLVAVATWAVFGYGLALPIKAFGGL